MRYSFLLAALSAVLLVAALWAYSGGYVVLAALGAATSVGLLFALLVRGWRRASAVVDGADEMLDRSRQRDAHSSSLDA